MRDPSRVESLPANGKERRRLHLGEHHDSTPGQPAQAQAQAHLVRRGGADRIDEEQHGAVGRDARDGAQQRLDVGLGVEQVAPAASNSRQQTRYAASCELISIDLRDESYFVR
jgi:hypothetical protein